MPTLIERLEAATGPDRELDAEIALVTGWGFDPEFLTLQWTSPDGQISKSLPPNFTGSYDAAMSLIDPRDELEITNLYGVARVAVGLNREGGSFYGENECGDIRLALCAAALRARGVK